MLLQLLGELAAALLCARAGVRRLLGVYGCVLSAGMASGAAAAPAATAVAAFVAGWQQPNRLAARASGQWIDISFGSIQWTALVILRRLPDIPWTVQAIQ